jgi:hypothetical protein
MDGVAERRPRQFKGAVDLNGHGCFSIIATSARVDERSRRVSVMAGSFSIARTAITRRALRRAGQTPLRTGLVNSHPFEPVPEVRVGGETGPSRIFAPADSLRRKRPFEGTDAGVCSRDPKQPFYLAYQREGLASQPVGEFIKPGENTV